MIAGDEEGYYYIWDFRTWDIINTVKGHSDRVRYIDLTPNENYMVTGSNDSDIKIWDLKRPRKELVLSGHKNWVKATIINKDATKIYSISDDKKAGI